MSQVLIAIEDPLAGAVATAVLKSQGHQCSWVSTGSDALRILRRYDFDLILVDRDLPDIAGCRLIREIRRQATREPPATVLMSFFDDRKAWQFTRADRPDRVLTKPLCPIQLRMTVASLLCVTSSRRSDRALSGKPGRSVLPGALTSST